MIMSFSGSHLNYRFKRARAKASGRRIILDMDWYRWDLGDFWSKLPQHPEFRKHFFYVQIRKDEIITPERQTWARSYVRTHAGSIQDICTVTFQGFNVWHIAKGDALAKANVPHFNQLSEEHFSETTNLLADIIVLIKFLPELFSLLQPHAIIVYEGVRAFSRAIAEVARLCQVRPVAIANNALRPGFLFFDSTTGMIVNRHCLAKCGRELLETRIFTAEQRQRALDTWRSGISQKTEQHRTGGIDDSEKIRQELFLPVEKPVAILLAHVRNDTSVVYDSPLYNDSVDFIADVIDFFAADLKDWILVVRLHPKEAGGFSPGGFRFNYETKQELERRGYASRENIRIVAERVYNTYTIMDIASVGITEVSQSGLEMAMLGKPVVTVGEAFYGHKGFTWDISHRSALRSVIADACISSKDTSLRSRIQAQALEFAYALFFEELVADDLSENFDKVLRTLERY